jgi:hypothetical protein
MFLSGHLPRAMCDGATRGVSGATCPSSGDEEGRLVAMLV